jgi:NAD(P)-dependent dehydrogenase (short-subunit alcohol dehydrogenase family)
VPTTPLEDLDLALWQSSMEVNLTGAFLCTQQAIRMMKSQSPMGGRIINNGSVSAQSPRPHSAAYTATKHAITGLTKSTSLDCRKYNIACGQIDIGNAGDQARMALAKGVPQANGQLAPEPAMDFSGVAHTIVHMASLPLEVNVQFITIMATNMPLIGRG